MNINREDIDKARNLFERGKTLMAEGDYLSPFDIFTEAIGIIYDYNTPECNFLKETINNHYKVCQNPPVNTDFNYERTFGRNTIIAFVTDKGEYCVACKASDGYLYYKNTQKYLVHAMKEWNRRVDILTANPNHIFG